MSKLDQGLMRAGAASAAEQRDASASVEEFASSLKLRSSGVTRGRSIAIAGLAELAADSSCNAISPGITTTTPDGCPHRGFEHGRQLRWMRNQFATMAALAKQLVSWK